jgi:hypothetical protein
MLRQLMATFSSRADGCVQGGKPESCVPGAETPHKSCPYCRIRRGVASATFAFMASVARFRPEQLPIGFVDFR